MSAVWLFKSPTTSCAHSITARLLGYSVAQHEETVRIARATTKDAEEYNNVDNQLDATIAVY